jgi:hypothetical protein
VYGYSQFMQQWTSWHEFYVRVTVLESCLQTCMTYHWWVYSE